MLLDTDPLVALVDRGDRFHHTSREAVGSFARKYVVAPMGKNQKVGDLVLIVDGKPPSTIPVLTQAAVPQGGFFKRAIDHLRLRI